MKYLPKVIPWFLVIIFFFISLFVYSKLGNPLSLSINSNVTNKTDIFTVTGEGKVVAKPDIAYISVGIEKSAATVKQAQNQVNEVNKNLLEAFKKLDIDTEKDIKTETYTITPTFDWTTGRQKITGYRAYTNLSVKVKDIDKINEVIDAATLSGANNVGSITFDIENKEKLQETARKDAVAQAKRKAEDAANVTGFKLGKIINYSESSNNLSPRPLYAAGESLAKDAASTQIQTGTEEIKIIVSLGYEVE